MTCGPDPSTACGCCAGLEKLTPVDVTNRPGLSSLIYRVGTHGQLKASMLAAISGRESLRRLGTRRDDDFTVGLIDAWAMALDVLTFYQERIANEAYLRTATERRSLRELARLIGYELGPGVAAEVLLAFTLDEADTSPRKVTIPAGIRAQSLPVEQDELPQSFETSEKLLARPGWNLLRPRQKVPQEIDLTTRSFYFEGLATGLRQGDPLLLSSGSGTQKLLRVHRVEADAEHNRTWVACTEGAVRPTREVEIGLLADLDQVTLKGLEDNIMVDWDRTGHISNLRGTWETIDSTAFGEGLSGESAGALRAAADDESVVTESTVTGSAVTKSIVTESVAATGEAVIADAASSSALFAGSLFGGAVNGGWLAEAADFAGWEEDQILDRLAHIRTAYREQVLRLGPEVYALRESTAPFGHDAPRYKTLPADWRKNNAQVFQDWDSGTGWGLTKSAAENKVREAVYLSREIDSVVAGSWLVLDGTAKRQFYIVDTAFAESIADFALNGRVTRLTLKKTDGTVLTKADYEQLGKDFKLRSTAIHTASERLALAELPISLLKKGTTEILLEKPILPLEPGRRILLRGRLTDGSRMTEELTVAVTKQSSISKLVLRKGLAHTYENDTVEIFANVAPANHGETRREVLGSGDASQPFQRFALKQKPLTYVAAPVASGGVSTLELEVDGVRWHETRDLVRAGPDDRVYTLRHDDTGRTHVLFGDGVRGARPATSSENLVATYRVGIGTPGLVGAERITLLATRPLGVKEVTNPLKSADAQDPETRDQARKNAPLTVLTLDRIVSLRDFEDFARSFSGIAKARADRIWDGSRRLVHVTVAGPEGTVPTDKLLGNLRQAMDQARDPFQPLLVSPLVKLTFAVKGRLRTDPDHDREKVLAVIRQALQERFSFAARPLGRRVARSEVLATIQRVKGVVAVDLDELIGFPTGFTEDGIGLPVLPARRDPASGRILPAQLLVLASVTSDPVRLEEMP